MVTVVERAACLRNPQTIHATGNCFPALGFQMPSQTPNHLNQWWCDDTTEYAFMGFSYEVTACKCIIVHCYSVLTILLGQSPEQLQQEFSDIRNKFHSRYVRLYGACDNDGF